MTDDYEDWDAQEQLAWEPKTPREEREPLANAPLATLRATPATAQAAALMRDLEERYPSLNRQRGRPARAVKTLVRYAKAGGAFTFVVSRAAAPRFTRHLEIAFHRTAK